MAVLVASVVMSTTETIYTWPWLLQAVQPPTQEQRDLYVIETPTGDLIERGARIRSQKILTDYPRLCGTVAEFWLKATPAQRRQLLGFSEGLLRVTVYAGKRLADMLELRGASTEDREAGRAAVIAVADQSYAEGMDARETLSTALEGVVGNDASLEARLSAARGQVTDGGSLSVSLVALVKLAKSILTDDKSKPARQLVDCGVEAQVLSEFEALAVEVKETDERASGARMTGPVSQAELDLQDGVCLSYLGRMMRVFNRAHERDRSIPKLVPIATRRMFSPNRKRSDETPEPEPEAKAEGQGEDGKAKKA